MIAGLNADLSKDEFKNFVATIFPNHKKPEFLSLFFAHIKHRISHNDLTEKEFQKIKEEVVRIVNEEVDKVYLNSYTSTILGQKFGAERDERPFDFRYIILFNTLREEGFYEAYNKKE